MRATMPRAARALPLRWKRGGQGHRAPAAIWPTPGLRDWLADAVAEHSAGSMSWSPTPASLSAGRSTAELTRADLDYCHAAMPGAFFDMVKRPLPSLAASEAAVSLPCQPTRAHVPRQLSDLPGFCGGEIAPWKRSCEALAVELGPQGATVNAVVPGLSPRIADRDPFLAAEEKAAMVGACADAPLRHGRTKSRP